MDRRNPGLAEGDIQKALDLLVALDVASDFAESYHAALAVAGDFAELAVEGDFAAWGAAGDSVAWAAGSDSAALAESDFDALAVRSVPE